MMVFNDKKYGTKIRIISRNTENVGHQYSCILRTMLVIKFDK